MNFIPIEEIKKFINYKLICLFILTLSLFLISSSSIYAVWGESWPGATSKLGGINVHNNFPKPATPYTDRPHNENGVYTGPEWECVELAQRYYHKKLNYLRYLDEQKTIKYAAWPIVYPPDMFYQVKNGEIGKLFSDPDIKAYDNGVVSNPRPVIGDLIIFDKSTFLDPATKVTYNLPGHVAVVAEVNGSNIIVAEQNFNEKLKGLRPISINSLNSLSCEGCPPIKGWIRSPKNPNIPKLNKMILSQNRTMQVKIISYSSECAGDLKQLNLESNTDKTLVENYQNNIGKTVDLGTFAQGSEIAFAIDTRKSSCYKYRPSTHTDFAKVTELKTDHWKIEWEDQDSGGNGDFDDLVIEVFPAGISTSQYIVSDTQTEFLETDASGPHWKPAVVAQYSNWSIPFPDALRIWRSSAVTQDEAVYGTPIVTFKRLFDLTAPATGKLQILVDDEYIVYINDQVIGSYGDLDPHPRQFDLNGQTYNNITLKTGTNELVIKAIGGEDIPGGTPQNNPAWIAYRLEINL